MNHSETIIVKLPETASEADVVAVRAMLLASFPEHPALVMGASGIEVYKAQAQARLDALEQKVDVVLGTLKQLVHALAEEGDEPQMDLDGNQVGGERDQSQGLG